MSVLEEARAARPGSTGFCCWIAGLSGGLSISPMLEQSSQAGEWLRKALKPSVKRHGPTCFHIFCSGDDASRWVKREYNTAGFVFCVVCFYACKCSDSESSFALESVHEHGLDSYEPKLIVLIWSEVCSQPRSSAKPSSLAASQQRPKVLGQTL